MTFYSPEFDEGYQLGLQEGSLHALGVIKKALRDYDLRKAGLLTLHDYLQGVIGYEVDKAVTKPNLRTPSSAGKLEGNV